MKRVTTPPRTGEEFIVAWFDDNGAHPIKYRYHVELEEFQKWYESLGWCRVPENIVIRLSIMDEIYIWVRSE